MSVIITPRTAIDLHREIGVWLCRAEGEYWHGIHRDWGDAKVIIWSDVAYKASVNGCEGLIGCSITDNPEYWPMQLWLREAPGVDTERDRVFIGGISRKILRYPSGICEYEHIALLLHPDEFNIDTIRFRLTCGQQIKNEDEASHYAMMNFLSLPYVDTPSAGQGVRQARREAERRGERVPSIHVVTLRRPKSPSENHGPSHRDWSCYWSVRGHWRSQWYAKTNDHRPKYILSYIKGDMSKPFKSPRPTVYKVLR